MTKFHEVGDILPNWVHCKKAKFGSREIIIGVTPVLYGMRVKAGYEGDDFVPLDYCAGADQSFLEKLYFIVERALILNDGDFRKFPIQRVKPVILDKDCYPSLLEMIGGHPNEEDIPEMPPINELRAKFNANPLIEDKDLQEKIMIHRLMGLK